MKFHKIFNLKASIILSVLFVILALVFQGCSSPMEVVDDTRKEVSQETVEEKNNEPEGTGDQEIPEASEENIESGQQNINPVKEIEDRFNLIEKKVDNIGDIIDFIDGNIDKATPELASTMVYEVLELSEEYEYLFGEKFADPEVQENIYKISDNVNEFDLSVLINTENQKTRELIEEAVNKNYRLINVEGFIMPVVDYKAYDKYKPYLTQEMSDYIDIKTDESQKPSIMDAGIVIPVDDFIKRIIKSMDYLNKYPGSPRFEEIKQFNDGMISLYLSGIDNNPVFDSGLKIIPDKLIEFTNVLAGYEDTDFGMILASYLELLEQEDYMRTEEIEDFLNSIDVFKYESTANDEFKDLIIVTIPEPEQLISSPLEIEGMARGTWFFEATFPVELLDGNDNIIVQHFAQAEGEWMTEEFVPFSAIIDFEKPDTASGTLLLIKNNPSETEGYNASIEIPVSFK